MTRLGWTRKLRPRAVSLCDGSVCVHDGAEFAARKRQQYIEKASMLGVWRVA